MLLAISMAMAACSSGNPMKAQDLTVAAVPDTLDKDEFTYEQHLAFKEALTPWYQAMYFGNCSAEDHFKMNCIDCETVGIDVILKIDDAGKVVEYKGLGPNIYCIGKHSEKAKQEFYECVLPSVSKIVLPALFYGKVLRVFIGDHLGC